MGRSSCTIDRFHRVDESCLMQRATWSRRKFKLYRAVHAYFVSRCCDFPGDSVASQGLQA